jgi:O-antigen/teichoic acid export membrane protein
MIARFLTGDRRSEAIYFVVFNVTNVFNYAYLVLVGFLVGTDSYGLFGALFGVVYLAGAVGNMVKMAVARHVATIQAQNDGTIARHIVWSSIVWPAAVAAVVGLALVAASAEIANAFDSPRGPVLWTSAAIALSISVPAIYGILQGLERFGALGSSLLVAALVRIGSGVALVAAGGGVGGAMAGVVLGFSVSAVFALALSLRQTTDEGRSWTDATSPRISTLVTVLAAGIVIAAPTSLDVAVVRNIFTAEEAGVYTGIAVLGRVIIFASLAVPFVILPKVASRTTAGLPTGGLLVEGLAITGIIAVTAAGGIVFGTDILGWQLGGIDVTGATAALHWYLAAMILFSLTVAVVHYHVGKGMSTFLLAIGLPGVVLQGTLIALIPQSLTAVAQIQFTLNAVLLTTGLFFSFASLRPASADIETTRIQPGMEASG